MDIKGIVNRICKKYETRNPFEIAGLMNIVVLFEELGSIRGYYQHCYRHKFIHINSELTEQQQTFTCAHELGHAIMHPNLNTPFLREHTFFNLNKLEIEANQFAAQLLYTDNDFEPYLQFPISQISQCLNLSESLVEYKINNINK